MHRYRFLAEMGPLEFIIIVALFIVSIWIYLSWRNDQIFGDEDKDVTDAHTLQEYVFRKIIRLFRRR